MVGRIECVRARIAAVQNAEVGPRFEPKIIGQAAGKPRWRVVLLAIRGHGQQRVVDVGGGTAAF